MTVLLNADPATAWGPWRPSRENPWDRRAAAHLYRRAALGASASQLDAAVKRTPGECVDELLAACGEHASARQQFDADMGGVAEMVGGDDPATLESWWLYRMIHTPAPLLERMTLLWHNLFATSAAKVRNRSQMLTQNRLLRHHALGNFTDLVQGISKDPAMLIYLDSTSNARLHPNENYARELMELFCLGVGNYTEEDIQQTARCFTGWEVRQGKFRFNRFQHDDGAKTIFGETGNFDGDDAVRIILAQPAAARWIARRLIREFVCDDVPPELVEPLAALLRKSDFEIAPVVRQILTSRCFFAEVHRGAKIRSPIDLALGLLRSLEGSLSTHALALALRPLGQRLFYPPNVKGWDGGLSWINTGTMIGRVNLVAMIQHHGTARFAGRSLGQYLDDRAGRRSPSEMLHELAVLLLATPLPAATAEAFVDYGRGQGRGDGPDGPRLLAGIAALPELQLA